MVASCHTPNLADIICEGPEWSLPHVDHMTELPVVQPVVPVTVKAQEGRLHLDHIGQMTYLVGIKSFVSFGRT